MNVKRHAIFAAICAMSATAGAADFAGRGVYYFASASGCPLSELTGNATQCNRVGLDDAATSVEVDEKAHKVHFSNSRSYDSKAIVGDLLLQGTAASEDGARVPVSFHLVLSKSGGKWSVTGHSHAPVKGRLSDVRIDPYDVDVTEAGGKRQVLPSAQIAKTLTDPGLAARFTSHLVQVRSNRAAGAHDADITIGLGASKLSKPVMRAVLHGVPAVAGPQAPDNWSFELEALTGKIPDRVAQRELFLYGLDNQPLLKPLMERGFASHDKLVVGASGGKGYLRYGDQQQPFDGADAVARAFLQQSFIGLVLGWQQTQEQVHAH